MNRNYIIPFLNDINKLNEQLNNFNDIKNQFNHSLDEFNLNQIKNFPSHLSDLLLNHFYIITSDWDDLYIKLKQKLNYINEQQPPTIALIFSGQGSLWNKYVLDIYENNKVFNESMNEIDNIMKEKYFGYSIINKLKSNTDENDTITNDTVVNQISLLMVQYSILKLFKYWNLKPSIVLGISFGEVVGSYASGMIPDLETLCYVMYNRCILQQKTFHLKKTMMWLNLGEDEFNYLFNNEYNSVEIVSVLSSTNIVIGGDIDQLETIEVILKSKSILSLLLKYIPTAFHHSCQEVLKDDILKLKFNSNPPSIPHVSTVDGNLFNDLYYFDNHYMYTNIRSTTRLQLGIQKLYKYIQNNKPVTNNNNLIFIEVGTKPTILNYIKQQIPNEFNNYSSISFLTPIQSDKGIESLNEMINNIKVQGYNSFNNI